MFLVSKTDKSSKGAYTDEYSVVENLPDALALYKSHIANGAWTCALSPIILSTDAHHIELTWRDKLNAIWAIVVAS